MDDVLRDEVMKALEKMQAQLTEIERAVKGDFTRNFPDQQCGCFGGCGNSCSSSCRGYCDNTCHSSCPLGCQNGCYGGCKGKCAVVA